MEFLFLFEPVANVIFVGGIVGLAMCVVLAIISNIIHFETAEQNDSNNQPDPADLEKKCKQLIVIFIFLFCTVAVINPFTQPVEIYKKVLVYRGINSDTAEKAVESINTLLDLVNKKTKEVK